MKRRKCRLRLGFPRGDVDARLSSTQLGAAAEAVEATLADIGPFSARPVTFMLKDVAGNLRCSALHGRGELSTMQVRVLRHVLRRRSPTHPILTRYGR